MVDFQPQELVLELAYLRNVRVHGVLVDVHSLLTCWTTSSRLMPRQTARRSSCNNASYSASLLETSNSIWNMYLSCSPIGLMKSNPTPPPLSLNEPLKYMTQCSSWLAGASTWFSHHSAMKSTSACDLMAVRGLKSRVRAPSSTAHLEMHQVVHQLLVFYHHAH
jgi:hypothetical protein